MFGKNRKHSQKPLFFWLIVVVILSVAMLLPGNRLLMSNIVNAGDEAPKHNTVERTEHGTPFEAYSKQVQKIQDTARTLQSELTNLYAQKESLENRLQLKQNLLDATKKQEENMWIKSDEQGKKKLQNDIDTISKELQNVEWKITTIYGKITTYSQEVADMANINH